MKNKIILVAGGAGFIGSHTIVELQNKGYDVIVADNLSNSKKEVIENIAKITGKKPIFVEMDFCDKKSVEELFKKHKIDAVINFAASKAVGESVKKPLVYYRNNIVSLLNIIEAMKENNCQALVFSSSCTVYGQPDKQPVTEQTPRKPAISPYGNTKQIDEDIIRDSCKIDDNFKAISLRYFNPIGAHSSALIGELPIGVPQNLVPFITQTAAGLRESLAVYGGDYNTPDGTCVRDYIHVIDLAKAHIIAVERMLEAKQKANYEIFNIGTGKGSSVLEVIKSFEKMSGKKLNYKMVPPREGDIEQILADCSFATNELGWKAELSLDDAMLSAWKWQQNQ